MQKGKNFQDLMNNMAKALKTHGVKELNEAIESLTVNTNNLHRDEIEYLLGAIAEEYSISKRTLKTARGIGDLKQARAVAYCILHFHLKLPCRHIAIKIFGHKAHNQVWEAIHNFNTLNDKVKTDRLFKEKYDICLVKLVSYIKRKSEPIEIKTNDIN